MEATNICSDKETDIVMVYANEHINGDLDTQLLEENVEIKECTFETPVVGSYMADELAKIENFTTKDKNKKSKSCIKTTKKQCTVPQPFALATAKRASCGNSATKSPKINFSQMRVSEKHDMVPRKPLQAKNKEHSDEEDSSSVASSSPTLTRRNKPKTTVAFAPVFKSTERAEKRKEYCMKLEEKQQALKAEKNECEARNREEVEEVIKQLRKSLTFKASPMPSFYHEGPSLKVELRKAPPSGAKSPKLGGRKSFSDANRTNPSISIKAM